jgi:TatD DNase family protein
LFDTHCHLTHPRLTGDLEGVVERARGAGLTGCVTIGTGVTDARHAQAIATRHPGLVAWTAGIDPFTSHTAGDRFEEEFSALETLLRGGDACAVGEIGLDYHHPLDAAEVQIERFERQLDLATRLDLPVVIHVREAHDDMLAVLRGHPRSRGVIHSFTAGPDEASAYLGLGWSLAVNGVVTYPSAELLRQAAREIPTDRLVVETDSPYLAPMPHRGKRCEPAHVAYTLRALADLRGETPEALAQSTTRNALSLFRLAGGRTE